MNKLKKSIVSVGLALSLVGGGAVAANAATWTKVEKWQTGGTYCPVMAYVDYNWWEELWGARDGWEYQYSALC